MDQAEIMVKGPTKHQIKALEVTERMTSILSLLGCSFIIFTFLSSRAFHKPINRLVFFASFGNVVTNIATLISTSGVTAGVKSPLCQTQAFIIQMFMPADSLWTLAMAFNVYLTFFRKYDQHQLRGLEWKYISLCYGIPSVPAIIFLFVQTAGRGKVYGPATLWCWVSPKWDVLRVACFYGPVWIVIVLTFAIYIIAGLEIFQKRRQLRKFASPICTDSDPVIENPFTSTKTTEVKITSETIESPPSPRCASPTIKVHTRNSSDEDGPAAGFPQYSVMIECGRGGQASPPNTPRLQRANVTTDANKAAWGYTRCAFFFFVALLVTWVPSSVNRVYALAHPNVFSFPLNYTSSLVLPLQGFWNAVIYISTSMPACRALWYQIVHSHGPAASTQMATSHQHRSLSRATTRVGTEKRISDDSKSGLSV